MDKVVLLVRNAAKNDFGGAETYQTSIATLLKDSGYTPIIVSRSQKLLTYTKGKSLRSIRGWWWSKQNWSGIQVVLVPFYIVWQVVLTVWYINLIIRTHASVLHIQSKDDFIAGTLAGRIMGKKVIWTDHMDLRYILRNISKPFRNPVGKFVFWSARFTNHIILISDNEHRLVTSHFKNRDDLKRQIVIIKNGVIDQKHEYPDKAKPNELFTYCIASRIVSNKGIGEAIEAFVKLESRIGGGKVQLAIYGDGDERDKFQKQAEPYNSIHFFGYQTDTLEKINDSDVFMLPSYQEGLSIALLEAMMLGKVIIASNVDSNPELIIDHETGLLVHPRDATALADAMQTMYEDEALRHHLKQQARQFYEKGFNLSTSIVERIIPLYEN